MRQPFSGNSLRLPTLCTTGRFQCMCKCKDLVCFSLQDIWKLHVMRLFLIIVICHRLLKYTQFLHQRTLDNLFKVLSACTGSGLEWVNKWTNSTFLVGLFYLARWSSALIYSFVQNSNKSGSSWNGSKPCRDQVSWSKFSSISLINKVELQFLANLLQMDLVLSELFPVTWNSSNLKTWKYCRTQNWYVVHQAVYTGYLISTFLSNSSNRVHQRTKKFIHTNGA